MTHHPSCKPESLESLCPRHSRHGKSARRGFRCICKELSEVRRKVLEELIAKASNEYAEGATDWLIAQQAKE